MYILIWGTDYHKFGQNILQISKYYVQNIWQVMRLWHHQLTHLHIHIGVTRNVSWKFAKLQSVITSLFFNFNQFSSSFHCLVRKLLLFLLKIKLKLFWISPLTLIRPGFFGEGGGGVWGGADSAPPPPPSDLTSRGTKNSKIWGHM